LRYWRALLVYWMKILRYWMKILRYWMKTLKYWTTDCTEETGMEEPKYRCRSSYVMLAAIRDITG
jgi:hypothetical protein